MTVVQTERCAIQVELEAQICLHDLLRRLYAVHFLHPIAGQHQHGNLETCIQRLGGTEYDCMDISC